MSSSALFQILYQHETLFHLPEDVNIVPAAAKPDGEELSAKATMPEPAVKAPLPEVSVLAESKTVLPPSSVATPPTSPDFPKLQHKVLILIDEQKQKDMLTSEALFLDNILKAVGHSTDHTDILNFSFLPGQDARKVFSEKRTNFFITFGVPLIKLHLDLLLAPYTPKNIDGIWFLLADPLVVIEADRNLKKKLWQALKQMFEMS